MVLHFQEVLAILHAFTCVVLTVTGHDHDGSYAQDSHGIHHIGCPAIVETEPGSNAFALLTVHDDKIVVAGAGRFPSRELSLS